MRNPYSTQGMEIVDANLGGLGAPCSFLPEPEALRNERELEISERIRDSLDLVGGSTRSTAEPLSPRSNTTPSVNPAVPPDATTPAPPPPKKKSGIKIAIGVGAGVVGLAVLARALGR